MHKDIWREEIRDNFNKAAYVYNKHCSIQSFYAQKLVNILINIDIPNGSWLDLGSGTGNLADEIEKRFPNKQVIRIDNSEVMLKKNRIDSQSLKILWDLNYGLPSLKDKPSLLVSNFSIQWLNKPEKIIQGWLDSLKESGYLGIVVPIQSSFPEWKLACQESGVNFSGIDLPTPSSLTDHLKEEKILINKTDKYVQSSSNVFSLLKNIIRIGAHSTNKSKNKVSELKLLKNAWGKNNNDGDIKLTWKIQTLLVKK
tara:strand:- start:6912 stop:7676 length:765 start_codon:yes stop_codon:yes gene_type:complete